MSDRREPAPDPASRAASQQLSHLDEQGAARMVDIGAKGVTTRVAVARATVRFEAGVLEAALAADNPKGEVLGTARVAAIQAAKRTADLIPLCHPLRLDGIAVDFIPRPADHELEIHVEVRATDRTGVEMEALHAASVAALTVYDMTKALSKATEIVGLRLQAKQGGKSGDYRRD